MNDLVFWSFVEDELLHHRPVVLLIVIDHEGSTPGRKGFKMAVTRDSRLCGSIGGGAIEFDLVEAAKKMLQAGHVEMNVQRFYHDAGVSDDTSGMICGGSQTVLTFSCNSSHLDAVQQISKDLAGSQSGWLRITDKEIFWNTETQSSLLFEEKLGYLDTVYIIGGGHVALALSRILATLDVRIVILDDRPDLDALRNNAYANDIIITPMEQVISHIDPGEHSWVVIMTPSHRADELVLRQLIHHPLRYLGMMASRPKALQILASLHADGIGEAALQSVRTPIGLPIASHTPAEIAVSIAAEIIQVRNAPLMPHL